MKKKKDIKKLLLVLILLIGIGLTIAYFFNTSTFSNIFLATETPRMRTVEDFKSPDDWEPGDETKKTSETTNVDYEGNLCIRVKFDESWVSKNGDTLDGYQNGNRAAIINYDNKTKWLKGSDGWYYYTDELAKGETSVSPIKSVTYNPLIENDQKCEETVTGTKKRIKCYTSGDGYDGATYTLTITTEGMDCDTSKLIWDIPTTYSIKYNYNSTTYNTKVIPTGEMSDDTSVVSTENHQLKKNEYTRTGYRFLGWSDDETATEAKYTDEDEVAELSTTDGAEVELYAVW